MMMMMIIIIIIITAWIGNAVITRFLLFPQSYWINLEDIRANYANRSSTSLVGRFLQSRKRTPYLNTTTVLLSFRPSLSMSYETPVGFSRNSV
jgi:hypothetical protein